MLNPESMETVKPRTALPASALAFDVKRFAIHDGPGIRLAVYLKGCPLSCWWCHNPEALRKRPTAETPAGERRLSIRQLMAEIAREQIFIDESGGGVTFSGGEPLVQIDFLEAALKACKAAGLHTALDTTGYAPPGHIDRVAPYTDLWLYDLKVIDPALHLKYTGVPNLQILGNLRRLRLGGARVWVRIPVVPGLTATDQNTAATIEFLAQLGGVEQVCLLPYHKAASAKYERLGMLNRAAGVEPPGDELMARLAERFRARRFNVSIGG